MTSAPVNGAAAAADFLGWLLPDEGFKVICSFASLDRSPRQFFCRTAEEAAAIALRENAQGREVYHACAVYKAAGSRKQENALGACAFWLDVDCGPGKPYPDAASGYHAVQAFVTEASLPTPVCLPSGLGLHVYWGLDRVLDPATWTPAAQQLKRLCERHALRADHSRTADIASILRPPGTHNRKYGQPLEVRGPDHLPDFTNAEALLAAIDRSHIAKLNTAALGGLHTGGSPPSMTQGYPDGQRTSQLTTRAGWCLGPHNMTEAQALAECLAWNQYNKPPLEEEKVRSTVASLARTEAEKRSSEGRALGEAPAGPAAAAAAATESLPADVRAEVTRLAALDSVSYDRERQAIADKLAIRVRTLDEEVGKLRPKLASEDEGKQGRALSFPEIEPWPQPVDGATLLGDIAAAISSYVVTAHGSAEALAAWSMHTHVFDAFSVTPRLAITSPEPRCGKTTLLDVIGCLVPRALLAANVTTAFMFRAIELAAPIILVDEADTFLGDNDELRGILNAGYRKGGSVGRLIGDDHEPRNFNVFAPVAIAMIGTLHATLADRSILIQMRRRRADEKIEGFRLDRVGHLDELKRRAARWATDNRVRLADADPAMPDGIFNRDADNWRAIFAIADAAGGDWPMRLREIAVNVVSDGAEQTRGVMLLMDIAAIFATLPGQKGLLSHFVCSELIKLDDRPWSEFGRAGKPLTPPQLARLLKPYGIRPRSLRDGDNVFKGYRPDDFGDAFARYGVASG